MAILIRRGTYGDFDPSKMSPGEFAVVLSGDPSDTSGYAVYACFVSGTVRRLVFADQLADGLDGKQDTLEFDSVPTSESSNPVTSGGIKNALVWANIANRPAIKPGIGTFSIVENSATSADGDNAHAEGNHTIANASHSHAEGQYTSTDGRSQHVAGEYNAYNSTSAGTNRGTYVEIIGNGTSDNNRSNARTLDWNGNEVLAGKLIIGAQPSGEMDVTTKKYVDDAISSFTAVSVDANGVMHF